MDDWEKADYRLVDLPGGHAPLVIENDGQNIKASNYWDSVICETGIVYMSGNAGALRILVPPKYEELATIKGVSEAIVSRGPWLGPTMTLGKDTIEVLLEDHTDTPLAFHIGRNQCDFLPNKDQRGITLSIWGPGARKLLELPCSYRLVPYLPWLKPWGEI